MCGRPLPPQPLGKQRAEGEPRKPSFRGGRRCAGRPGGRPACSGGMKQPRISAERAKCGSGAQSAFQLFGQPGSMVHHRLSDPEAHGDQHAARGAWPQVSSNAGGSDGGKGMVGSRGGGVERKPSSAAFTPCVQLAQAERKRLPLPSLRTRHLPAASRVTLSVSEHRRPPSPAVPGGAYFPG